MPPKPFLLCPPLDIDQLKKSRAWSQPAKRSALRRANECDGATSQDAITPDSIGTGRSERAGKAIFLEQWCWKTGAPIGSELHSKRRGVARNISQCIYGQKFQLYKTNHVDVTAL